MVTEARLEAVESGLAPGTDGWFVVNVGDAAWLTNDAFGGRCIFEGDRRTLGGRPELGVHRFADLGVTLAVLAPGRPSGLYHAESGQEDFLVLAGECLLLVEGEERPLKTWDFVHCPPGTGHVFVGAGDGPCVLFMTGARTPAKRIVYPHSELALRHGAGVEAETSSPSEAYASRPHWHWGGRIAGTAFPGASSVRQIRYARSVTAGQILRDARRRHGLTQAQLAARGRTSQAAISRIERDLVSPSVETLRTLLDLMGEELVLDARAIDYGHDRPMLRANIQRSPVGRIEAQASWSRGMRALQRACRR